jgi:hypothetical protein
MHHSVKPAASPENNTNNNHNTLGMRNKFSVVHTKQADFRFYHSKAFNFQNLSPESYKAYFSF